MRRVTAWELTYGREDSISFTGLKFSEIRVCPARAQPTRRLRLRRLRSLRRLARLFRVKITNTNTQRRKAGRDELSSCDEASEYLET